MTKLQMLLLAVAIAMIGTGLYLIAVEQYLTAALVSSAGAIFASLSTMLGTAMKAKKEQEDQCDAG